VAFDPSFGQTQLAARAAYLGAFRPNPDLGGVDHWVDAYRIPTE